MPKIFYPPDVEYTYLEGNEVLSQEILDFYADHWLSMRDSDIIMGLSDPKYIATINLQQSQVFVARYQKQIIGILTFSQIRSEFGLVLVHPEFRRFGVGYKLGQRVIQILELPKTPVNVSIDSPSGGHLIEKLKAAFPEVVFQIT